MKLGSLCAGIGGLELGVTAALGCEVAWQAEIDPAASKVLAHHWPTVPNIGDVRDLTAMTPVDVLTAGYPCQPFSTAGRRKGTDDPRHLWPAVHAAIAHLGPSLALLENVRGHITLGFDQVLGDLADIGYDAEWRVVRASDVGCCHQRARLFVAAYPGEGRRRAGVSDVLPGQPDPQGGLAPDPERCGLMGGGHRPEPGSDRAAASSRQPEGFTPEYLGVAGEGRGASEGEPCRFCGHGRWVHKWASGYCALCGDGCYYGQPDTDIEDREWGWRANQDAPNADSEGLEGPQPAQGRHLSPGGAPADPPDLRRPRGRGARPGRPGPEDSRGQTSTDPDGGRCEVGSQLDCEPLEDSADGHPRGGHADGRFGPYAAAVHRQERWHGPAPDPTTDGRLNPRFVEWMQGFPPGWVEPAGSRNNQLRCLGNAVVPQVAYAFTLGLLDTTEVAA